MPHVCTVGEKEKEKKVQNIKYWMYSISPGLEPMPLQQFTPTVLCQSCNCFWRASYTMAALIKKLWFEMLISSILERHQQTLAELHWMSSVSATANQTC